MPDTASANAGAETPSPPPRPDRAAKIRLVVLSTVLCVLLFALWYDYEVARTRVDDAYATILSLNRANNRSADFVTTTRRDVRRALGRRPDRVFQEGPFTIEEYGWTAGVPIVFEGLYSETPSVALRTHDYYAVYLGTRLATHYKFYLPLDEVRNQHSPQSRSRPPQQDTAEYLMDREYYRMMDEYQGRMENMPGVQEGPTPGNVPAGDSPQTDTSDAETSRPTGPSI